MPLVIPKNLSPTGQGLAEYALIGGAVALLSLPAVALLGGKVNGLFGTMLGTSQPQIAATAKVSGSSAVPAQSSTTLDIQTSSTVTPATPSGSSSPPGTGNVSVKLADGSTLTVPNYPTGTAKSVQTSGTNGTTEMLVASLRSMAQELLASGEITQAQADSITDLANQGHGFAQIEALSEADLAASADTKSYLNSQIQYNGKSYSPLDLTYLIGVTGPYYDEQGVSIPGQATAVKGSPMMATFYATLGQIANDPAIDATARQTINVMGNQIANLANGAQTAVYMMVTNGEQINQYASRSMYWGFENQNPNVGAVPDSVLDLPASTLTHQDSTTICGTGQNQDSGIDCTSSG